jgi:hypothetical protein
MSFIASIRYRFSVIIYLLFNISKSLDSIFFAECACNTGNTYTQNKTLYLFYFQYFRSASNVFGA